MEKVMEAEPWSFDKRLMVLQRYGREMDVGDMEFRNVTFWVQVHDLPIRFQTKKIAEQLCEAIGEVNKEIAEAESEGDNFMRVRVTIDITQPLSRGRVVLLDSGKELWVHFKYERLPSLCFWCGCLVHEDRDCELWVDSEGSLLPESQQFGPWLKAAPFVPSRKYVVKVPGIFNAKKADAATAKSRIAKQTPVVVVRSGKLAPEIVRSENIFTTPESILLENEGFDVHKAENKEPDLQEPNNQDTRQSTMGGKKEDVTIQHAGQPKKWCQDSLLKRY
uniref:Zinc knuckle CX2CX4HX4C domain-containing protein n=1 Tax=Quercus lobata TaxID=97700 RepID=A0A7N2MYR1_QUELO